MKKTLLSLLLFLCFHAISAQDHLPTINAGSDKVDIRVGSGYFIKGGWILTPDKKPDVFSIGSKWPYETQKVTFITDTDSISFDVKPGSKYDFVIMLHQKTPCYTQISTLPNPVFMNPKLVFPILAGFIVILVLVYFYRNKINVLFLLSLGYVAPLLFWLITFVSGYIHGNYNQCTDVISELGALGTKSEVITSASLIFLALLSTLFSIGFYIASKALKISVIPAVLSFSKPVTMIWAAIFPLGNEFHSFTGPLPLLIIIASLLAFLLWRKNNEFTVLRILSLLSFFVMMLILLRFAKPFGYEYQGLVQRFFYTGWTIWTLAISYFLSQKIRSTPMK